MANSIFGVDGKALSDEHSEILAKGSTIFSNSKLLLIYNVVVQFVPIVERVWKMSMIPKPVEDFFVNLTCDAVQMRVDSKVSREDFLNYLIQLRQKKPLEDIDFTAHAMTFFLDGYETSSMVIANMITHLARHPEIQDKVRSEIASVVARGETIGFEQIFELEYLEQVFNGDYKTKDIVRQAFSDSISPKKRSVLAQ